MLRQMEAEDFRVGRTHHRLADAKHQPHRQQHRESSHQTRCRRGKRPEHEAGCYHPVDVKAVHYPSADELHRGVSPKKCGELNDHKGGIDLKTLKGGGLKSLAVVAGELLARGHARSGDPCMIHGYCGSGSKIVKAITDFASQYADQTEADYAKFKAAIKNKKIKVAGEAAA
ncbi:MAG: hypothetical protein DMG72_07750 [Acidobacteria bacterium]|nr:MAG: hypothetical protein DMG72_07750 [Acidobacteriota bacterium]